MNLFGLSRKSFFVMLLSLMALVMLPACSSTEEAPATDTGTAPTGETSDTSGDRDCSVFTNPIDVQECEVWNTMN